MKRILSIIALLMAFAASGFAADKTVYLKPNADWLSTNARFALCMRTANDVSGNSETWTDFTKIESETDLYKATVPEGIASIICCRMNGEATENNWDNKWNATQWFTEISDKTLYTITGWNESCNATATSQPTKVIVAGVSEITNNYEYWNQNTENNVMVLQSDFTYSLTVADRVLEAGTYYFKVKEDNNWYPSSDEEIVITDDGVYDIVYTFGSLTNNVKAVATKKADANISYKYRVVEYIVSSGNYTDLGEMTTITEGEEANEYAALTISRSFDEATTIEYQYIKKMYNGETLVRDQWIGLGALNSNGRYNFEKAIDNPGNYNITFKIKFADNTQSVTLEQIPNTYTVQFVNAKGWTEVYAYAWTGDGNSATPVKPWRGEPMTKSETPYTVTATGQSYDLYTYSFEAYAAPEKILFHNNTTDNPVAGESKTADLDFVDGKTYTDLIPTIPGTPIWTSETPVGLPWINSQGIELNKSLFTEAKVGDILHVILCDATVNSSSWDVQVILRAANGNQLEGTKAVGGQTAATEASFTLTGDILSILKDQGGQINGLGAKTKLITLESSSSSSWSDYSVWFGYQSTHVYIAKEHFANANNFTGVKVGDVIRVTRSNNTWVGLAYNNSNWQFSGFDEGDIASSTVSDNIVDFIIMTESAAAKMNGANNEVHVIINVGNDNTPITQVELIPLTGYYLVGGTNTWTVSENPMNEKNGVYSATIPYSSGYEFAIAPNTALNASNNAVLNWSATIRPESLTEVKFVNNSGTGVATSNSTQKWKMKALSENESQSYTTLLTYNPETKAWTTSATSTVTISAAGYATYSNAEKFEVAEGPEVYIVKDASTSVKLTEPDSRVLPGDRGAGIILKGSGDVTIKSVDADAETAHVTDNLLVGSCDWSFTFPGGYSNIYILANGNSGVGFYPWDTTSDDKVLAAHKAFLTVPNGAREFISFEDMTTAISEELRTKGEEFATAPVYNLNGQRVAQPTKGLYIVNGRKVVIK